MIAYDPKRAKQAVQYLVDASYFSHHMRKLRSSLPKPRSLPFRGETEVLNELLVIGRQSVEAFENLISLAEFKRSGENKSSYQREYMAAKRQRDRKVVKLEETMAGRKLTLEERTTVLQRQYKVWNKERDALVGKTQDLPWAQRNDAIRDFWQRKEFEIEQLQGEAEAAQRSFNKPKKYRVEVTPPKPTAMREAFKHMLDKRT